MEEDLREASCVGNLITVKQLVEKGVSVNSQNAINGWTPLHWACKRGHINIVQYLLQSGSDATIVTHKGEQPGDVATNNDIIQLLDGTLDNDSTTALSIASKETRPIVCNGEQLNFVPNYLKFPVFPYSAKPTAGGSVCASPPSGIKHDNKIVDESITLADGIHQLNIPDATTEHLLVKVRIANSSEEDFIEVETDGLTYTGLLKAICGELEVSVNDIVKIRKLPNVLIRKDKDVARLVQGQELEVVLNK